MGKIIWWIGMRDGMMWFRRMWYKVSGGKALWGILQFQYDTYWSKQTEGK